MNKVGQCIIEDQCRNTFAFTILVFVLRCWYKYVYIKLIGKKGKERMLGNKKNILCYMLVQQRVGARPSMNIDWGILVRWRQVLKQTKQGEGNMETGSSQNNSLENKIKIK